MSGIIVDDLLEPINDMIRKNLINKIPKQNNDNCTVKYWTSLWRIGKDGKRTCLEFKRVK